MFAPTFSKERDINRFIFFCSEVSRFAVLHSDDRFAPSSNCCSSSSYYYYINSLFLPPFSSARPKIFVASSIGF
jgi:hypothetical protein